MKKQIAIFVKSLLLAMLPAQLTAHQHATDQPVTPARIMQFLDQAKAQCQATPDSIFPALRQIEQMKAESKDEVTRAVLAECLAMLYQNNRWMAQHNSTGEEIEEWGREQWDDAVRRNQAEARRPMAQLHAARASKWGPLITHATSSGKKSTEVNASAWFGNDVLHLMLINQPTEEVVQYYEQQVGGNAAVMARLALASDEAETRALLDKALADKHVCNDVRLLVYERLVSVLRNSNTDEAVLIATQCLDKYGKEKMAAGIHNLLAEMRHPIFIIQWPRLCYPGKQYRIPVRYRNISEFTVRMGDKTLKYECRNAEQHVTVEDTITFTAPGQRAAYKVTFEPANRDGMRPEAIKDRECTMYVSPYRLLRMSSAKEGEPEYIIVDGQTGKRADDQRYEVVNQPTRYNKERKMVRIAGDPQPAVEHWKSWGWKSDNDTHASIKVYTDRAIYRPGQTVHLSSLAYNQRHWTAEVAAGQEVAVHVVDRKGVEIYKDTLATDQFGCISTTFALPSDIPLGACRISVSLLPSASSIAAAQSPSTATAWHTIRVEEYKRPTYEVVMDEKMIETDSTATIGATVRNFNGTPLREATVTGTYWIRGYWWRWQIDNTHAIDTLHTDAEGRLTIPVEVPKSDDERRYRCLEIALTVVSATGETHSANQVYRLCNEQRPQEEPDTMPKGAESWFHVRNNIICANKAAVVEAGSALDDVHLYYSVFRQDECIRHEEIVFSDSLLTLEFGHELIAGYPDCDGLGISLAFMKNEKLYAQSFQLKREQPDNELKWAWNTFRDRVQPGNREQWCGTLLTPDGQPADANAMFTIYDASLDEFERHEWKLGVNRSFNIVASNFADVSNLGNYYYNAYYRASNTAKPLLAYYQLAHKWLNGGVRVRGTGAMLYGNAADMKASVISKPAMNVMAAGKYAVEQACCDEAETEDATTDSEEDAEPNRVKARGEFSELACFEPSLRTNACGQLTLNFTLPDCMTTWNIMGVAHTKDMMTAGITSQTVAQKTLMCMIDVPRFMRMGDKGSLAVTLQNISGEKQDVTLRVELIDSETDKVTETLAKAQSVTLEGDQVLHFAIPAQTRPFIARAVAVAGCNSDGEQREVPVLDDSEWIATSTDLLCRGEGCHTFDVKTLYDGEAEERRMTVHYTESPVWTAIDVIRNIQEPEHDDVISLHTALYATTLANHLVSTYPALSTSRDSVSGEYMTGITATDIVEGDSRAARLLNRLDALQHADGGYSWFKGFYPSYWLTLEVATTFARLQKMTGRHYAQMDMAQGFMRREIAKMVKERKSNKADYCTQSDLQYLYVLALTGQSLDADARYLLDCFLKQAKDKDGNTTLSREQLAIGTVVLRELKRETEAAEMESQLRKYIVRNERQGAFFSYLRGSFTSIDRKLTDHVYAMEALEGDESLLPDMRRWLLQQKRVQAWENPIYNAAAVYALLLGRTYNLDGQRHDIVRLSDGKKAAGEEWNAENGRISLTIDSEQLQAHPVAKVEVEKHNPTESWGAVYVESRMKVNEIQPHTTGLDIRRYIETAGKQQRGANDESPRGSLAAGHNVQVRLVISADRDYECVHVSVPRAACLEPVHAMSGYRRQGGLTYYHEVHDAADDLFIEHLPKGVYVLTLESYATRPGTYNAGIAKIECMYAAEFCGNTANEVIEL